MDEAMKILIKGLKEDLAAHRLETREQFKEVNVDLKALLAFKWQIIGGSVALSAIVSFVVTVGTAILQR